MEHEPKFRVNGRKPQFSGKLAGLFSFPELVTAQPQLVIVLIMLTDVREWHIFDLCFTRLEITLFTLEGCIKFVYNYLFSIKQIFDFVTSFR